MDVLNNFLMMGPQDTPVFDVIFKKMFNCTVFEANEAFFEAFLFSLNKRFLQMIEDMRKKNAGFTYNFSDIMWIMTVIMYNLVQKVFIAPNPKEAVEHFRDKLGRYTQEQLALRVLELRIFKDIPLSDNNWPDYYLSRNKNVVKKYFQPYVEIPDHYFFSPERLLKINKIYDRGLLETTHYLEEWLFKNIIKQFFAFQQHVLQKLPEDFTTVQLSTALEEYFSQGIIDERQREGITDFVESFVEEWDI
jgi:hypothetical protein